MMRTAVATKRAARTRRWAMRLVVASMRKDCSGPPAAGTTLAKSVMEKRGKLVTTSVFAPVSLAPLRAVTVSQVAPVWLTASRHRLCRARMCGTTPLLRPPPPSN